MERALYVDGEIARAVEAIADGEGVSVDEFLRRALDVWHRVRRGTRSATIAAAMPAPAITHQLETVVRRRRRALPAPEPPAEHGLSPVEPDRSVRCRDADSGGDQ